MEEGGSRVQRHPHNECKASLGCRRLYLKKEKVPQEKSLGILPTQTHSALLGGGKALEKGKEGNPSVSVKHKPVSAWSRAGLRMGTHQEASWETQAQMISSVFLLFSIFTN